MAREIPADRFERLVDAATEVFIARGYDHTQMAGVAEALGVSKGTLYLYVESKEALFALCLRESARSGRLEIPDSLPLASPRRGELSEFLERVLEREAWPASLSQALKLERAQDIRAELSEIYGELYSTMERFCRGIKLIDRCWDHPELSGTWQAVGREAPRNRMVEYIESRIAAGQIRDDDPRLLARIALENVTTWAVHIKWDRSPQAFDALEAKRSTLEYVVRGLLA